MEKPFECGYCPARYMRKNEAVRHENNHKQQKVWSCAALGDYTVAFGLRCLALEEWMTAGIVVKSFPTYHSLIGMLEIAI